MSKMLNFFFSLSISILLISSKNIYCMDTDKNSQYSKENFNGTQKLLLLKQEAGEKLLISKAILENNINFFKDQNNIFIKKYINSYLNLTFKYQDKIEFIGYPLLKAARLNQIEMVVQ